MPHIANIVVAIIVNIVLAPHQALAGLAVVTAPLETEEQRAKLWFCKVRNTSNCTQIACSFISLYPVPCCGGPQQYKEGLLGYKRSDVAQEQLTLWQV